MLVGKGEGFDHLRGWIADDDISADEIVTGGVEEHNPIGIPADIVFLDHIVAAAALETEAEVDISVWIVEAAIPVMGTSEKFVPVAVRGAYAPASCTIRPDGMRGDSELPTSLRS